MDNYYSNTSTSHEKTDDVTTWGMQTIRDVAFDLEDEWINEEEEDLGAYGGLDNIHSPVYAPIGINTAPLPSGGARPRGRKLKMYQWPPQEDPKLEKKRLRALKQREQRLRTKQSDENLRHEFVAIQHDVQTLEAQKMQRQQNVQMYEQLLAQQKLAAQQGYGRDPFQGSF